MASPSQKFLQAKGWTPLPHQEEAWAAMAEGKSGLVHSSTGTGKTLSVWLGFLNCLPQRSPEDGLRAVWITPLRSLATDTLISLREAAELAGVPLSIQARTGDTGSHAKQKQLKEIPDVLVTTPESLTLMLTLLAAEDVFASCRLAVVDEWHELLGSKRGVQTELALARLRRLSPELQTWGLSATLGNTQEAAQALIPHTEPHLITGPPGKEIFLDCLLPSRIDRFPWAGHMGQAMMPQVIKEAEQAESSLVFCNTRATAEIWHQAFVASGGQWQSQAALHHGSLDPSVRLEAEEGLKQGTLKAVICTSSLDLGVDFSPVERVFQIGSPKGVARMLQRAGRSGHRPGAVSRLTCVPTHAWELLDIAAARRGAVLKRIEARKPQEKPLDVLSQHLVTLALGRGFVPSEALQEIRETHAFRNLTEEEFFWALEFITKGGPTLQAYPEFRRVIEKNGRFVIADKILAQRHKAQVGTIVADAAMEVKMITGARLGTVEESFASRLRKGDCFIFAGRALEFVSLKESAVLVKKATRPRGFVPRWGGGRMPLSSELARTAREIMTELRDGIVQDPELQLALPLLKIQAEWSALPGEEELLIEVLDDQEGHHLFVYPMEGRLVHEGLAALIATRLGRLHRATYSLACSDYGLEVLSNAPIPLEEALEGGLFSPENLTEDILESLNGSEMAKRQFREIARVAGLIQTGFPGQNRSAKQVQASSGLLFDVFSKYDPTHLLLRQAHEEALQQGLERTRLNGCLRRISESRILIRRPPRPTPMAFPILVDRLRETMGSESFEDRIRGMVEELEDLAGE